MTFWDFAYKFLENYPVGFGWTIAAIVFLIFCLLAVIEATYKYKYWGKK